MIAALDRQPSGSVATAPTVAVALVALLPDLVRPASNALISAMPRFHVALATFAAICVQALPLVLLGAVVSASLAQVMTPARWGRVIPGNRFGATLVGAVAGIVVPTCECSSVAVARRMMGSGVRPEAALTFMVAAPSLNPIVFVATWIAFGGAQMAVARWAAALVAVIAVGLAVSAASGRIHQEVVARLDRYDHEHEDDHGHGCSCHRPVEESRGKQWLAMVRHDAVGAATFLVIGGAIAASVSALLPASAVATISDNVWVSVALMATIAVVASLCSLGDAFVAASFVGLPTPALLAFLIVGPIIDLKLAAMMEGMLGHRATKVVAATGIVAGMACAIVAGTVLGWSL